MHISDGYLPVSHCAVWSAAAAPLLWRGARLLASPGMRARRMEIAAAGGMLLLLTSLKLPSVAGSSSHPAGVALAAIMLGPWALAPLSAVVLLLQALLLAHGGFTTLGANTVSLGIVGPWLAWALFRLFARTSLAAPVAAGFSATLSSVGVYGVAAAQMALAYPDPHSGFSGALVRFLVVFAWTQVPVALAEGLLTAFAYRLISGEASPRWEAA